MIGDALVLVAIGIYVTRLTGRPSDVGLVLGAYTLSLAVVILFGGVVADRLPRRKVMIYADLVRGSAHATLAVLILTDVVQIWHMVVIGVVFGTAEALFRPAFTGLLPQTVAEADIAEATALSGISEVIPEFLGPAFAAALVLGVGGAAAFGFDAATFVLSACLLAQIHVRQRGAKREDEESSSLLTDFREGWSVVTENSWVWVTIVVFGVALFAGEAPFAVLGASVARRVYGTEAVYGYATAAFGAGLVIGALIGSRWRVKRPMFIGMLFSVPWPLGYAVFGAGWPIALMLPLLVFCGVGIGVFTVLWQTALAERIPPHALSRVAAWDWMGALALLPLGYVSSGWVAGVVGDQQLLVGGGILAAAALALGLIPRDTRTLLAIDQDRVGAEVVELA